MLIPARAGPAVLALLDATGRPRAGWPVELPGVTSCEQLLPVEDGSIRLVCSLGNPNGDMFSPKSAFAFHSDGRSLEGWPVDLHGRYFQGRVAGDDLTLLISGSLDDAIEESDPAHEDGLVTVAADGRISTGVRGPIGDSCCGGVWSVGPEGIAYRIDLTSGSLEGSEERSRISALDASGMRAGWPIDVDGIASAPGFGPGGRNVVIVGSVPRKSSRVLAFDRDGQAISTRSAEFPLATVEEPDTGGCTVGVPNSPLVAQDGTTFVFSEIDSRIYALDRSLAIRDGWPFDAAAPLERARPGLVSEQEAGYCPAAVTPGVGPDSTLYLPLQARNETVGGSIVAVGPDGRVRPGWPVELQRPGAEFWSVVIGSDGTVHALAIEPEANDASSASILAIAPDSTVLSITTIVEP